MPTDKSAEDLLPLFADFGNIRNLHLVKGPDGKSRGGAMVLCERWSQAEAAVEAHDGKAVLPAAKAGPWWSTLPIPGAAVPQACPQSREWLQRSSSLDR